MPQKYVVPQFIDIEDKILGPVTVRQFVILLIDVFVIAATYAALTFIPFLILGIIELCLGIVLAFVKVNGQPFHFFLLNVMQTFRRPNLRVWDKRQPDAVLRALISEKPAPPPPTKVRKEPLAGSRLSELTLVVNTGGAYRPDDIGT
jgi:hypothetical protein